MLKLNSLKPAAGSHRNSKRLGRGTASGQGKTAGYGSGGAKSRSGRQEKFYFEGGQTPLTRGVPKVGFHSPFKKEYQIVNVGSLEEIDVGGRDVTAEVLREFGLIHDAGEPVKILGTGEFTKPLTFKVNAYSKTAKEKIEKAKGKAEVV
ncbi:MAG: 50S ribosomal protein L15 [Chitinispirillales bacterium]|jgi:large subunit ribosomal protein L15|nr:50S ribosomal protein L15 [Chitinispirillales bacterium]